MLINPRPACAARVTVLGLCVCVCLSVYLNSRPTGYEPAYKRYQRLKRTKDLKNYVADFAETSAFELKRETVTSGDDISWPNPLISGVHMHMRTVAHEFIIPRGFLSFFREAVLVMEASRYKLSKVCPQCGTTVHIRRAVSGCRYTF